VDFALAVIAFAPGLAFGSFLNVLAARVPLKRSIVRLLLRSTRTVSVTEEGLRVYEHCAANGIAIYGGGQGEVELGRGQIQYLASLFHPDTPNDTAPSGYNDPAVPSGLPTAPMDPMPAPTGFRWG